ncbi:MAG: pyrroline-5-carboxylate reductase [Candidatus Hadarchaeales archaeon]
MKIGIIGAGNMGLALAKGILLSGKIAPENILISDKDEEKLELAKNLGVSTTTENKKVTEESDIVFLAVKPAVVRSVLTEISEKLNGKLLISIAAGIDTKTIERLCGARVIRVMPNICAEIGEMTACYSLGSRTRADDERILKEVLAGAGKMFKIDEELMDAATAICGSGPAFFLELMRAAEDAAVELGFERETARQIISQVARGAAELLKTGEPDKLITRICTRGGTTERGMKVLEEGKVGEIFRRAFRAAAERSRELKKEI